MIRRSRAATTVVALLLTTAFTREAGAQTPPAAATPAPPTTEELEQRIRILERKLELADEAAAEKAKATPTSLVGADGFGWKSADGAFQLKLRGLLQTDGRFYVGDDRKPVSDTLLVRRARPIVEAVFFKDFELRLMPDFGDGKSQLLDASLDWRVSPWLTLRAGKFKVPIGLEALAADAHLPFVERGAASAIAPVRDVGVQASGEPRGGRFSWTVGVFNGQADGVTGDGDSDDDKEIAGRLLFRPFRRPGAEAAAIDLTLGIAFSAGKASGTTAATGLPSYRTAGNQTFFSFRSDSTAAGTAIADGTRRRIAPQASLYVGPLGLTAEWTRSEQETARGTTRATLANDGWQVALAWVATGERMSERGVAPRRPFAQGKGHGALALAARAGVLTVDAGAFPLFADPTRSARRAMNLGASANWILNRNAKLVLDYECTAFDGGDKLGTTAVDRETEQVLLGRIQLTF